MRQDIRYAVRGFARSPGFVATVVATIAVALGLNTTMFTVFNSYVLRPFEIRDPYGLYTLTWTAKRGREPVGFSEFERLSSEAPRFQPVLTENVTASIDGQPVIGQRVSLGYFDMLGVPAAMGRTFLKDDVQTMVLSYGAWTGKFATDPNILGRSFIFLGKSYTVVGVARRGFDSVSAAAVDFWIPLLDDDAALSRTLLVRLAPGVPVRAAQTELGVLAARLTADRPEEQRANAAILTLNATPLSLGRGANYILFAPVFAAFGLVLLIACANVANMLLARAAGRQKEISIRLALGAPRARIVRQLLVESLLLALPSALAAYAVARITLRAALQLYFATVPGTIGRLIRILPLEPDLRVLGFLLAAAIGATLAFGLAPAIQAAKERIATASPSRLRNALVITQVAVCSLLLIVAGVLLRGSAALETFDPGFATRNISTVRLDAPPTRKLVDELRAESWVDTVAVAAVAPLQGHSTIAIGPAASSTVRCNYNLVSPEYFTMFNLAAKHGRLLTPEEARAEAPVAVISEATARQFWPDRDPVGEVIRIDLQPQVDRGAIPPFRSARIVGVVRDISSGDLSEGRDSTMFYFPAAPGNARAQSLLIRTMGDTEAARRALTDAIERSTSSARLVFSLDEMLTIEIFPFRLSFGVAGFLGGLALLLAVSGVYGVLSFLVMQRRREIGIRIALGASAGSVAGLVLAQSARFALWGILIGAGLALSVSRVFASILEEINTYEPLAYAVAIAAVFAAALAAAYWPSRRASRIDPASTLRCE